MLYVDILHGMFEAGFTDKIPAAGSSVDVLQGIVSMGQFRFAQASAHGGAFRGEYGTMVLVPELMAAVDSSWYPPPQVLEQVTVGWYLDDGSEAYWSVPGIFVGWLESWDANGAVYSLRERGDYGTTEIDKQYTGTLTSCFIAACSALGLSHNITWARSTSPAVDWLAEGERKILDNLSDLAKFFDHAFFIDNGTLYLVDCLTDAVALTLLQSADVRDVAYFQNPPIKQFTADWSPLSLKWIKLEFLEPQNGGSYIALSEFNVSKAENGFLGNPGGLVASAAHPGNPESNMLDDNTSTIWVSGPGTVPGVTLITMMTIGSIKEYAMTAHSNPEYSPVKWNLYGRNDYYLGQYEFIQQVESTGWGALEQRKFTVPVPTWKVRRNNPGETSYLLGEVMDISPVCQKNYTLIANALLNINTDMNRKRCRYTLPIREIKPRQKVFLSDSVTTPTNNPYPIFIASWIRVDALTYNFDDGIVTVEGGGDWSQI